MDPNTPSEQNPDTLHDSMDQQVMEAMLQDHLSRLPPAPESVARVLLVDDGSIDLQARELITRLARERNIDIVLPPVLEAPVTPTRRERVDHGPDVVLVSPGVGIHRKMMEAIASIHCAVEAVEPHYEIAVLDHAPSTESKRHVKAKPAFKQFQNTRHNHGPSARRQFSQIRPPRRGGR